MSRLKQGIVVVLLAASIVMTTAEAYAAVPRMCAAIRCLGGPDECMSIRIGFGYGEATMTCYTRIPNITR